MRAAVPFANDACAENHGVCFFRQAAPHEAPVESMRGRRDEVRRASRFLGRAFVAWRCAADSLQTHGNQVETNDHFGGLAERHTRAHRVLRETRRTRFIDVA